MPTTTTSSSGISVSCPSLVKKELIFPHLTTSTDDSKTTAIPIFLLIPLYLLSPQKQKFHSLLFAPRDDDISSQENPF
jgi:hypothetical protein